MNISVSISGAGIPAVSTSSPILRTATAHHIYVGTTTLTLPSATTVRVSRRIPVLPGKHVIILGQFAKLQTKTANIFRQFSHYPVGSVDPALALASGVVGGVAAFDATAPSNFRRISMRVVTPVATDGTDAHLWDRAAFVGVGVRVKGMAAGNSVYVDGAQVEWALSGATTPSPYSPARALRFNVRPNRVNYCPNPRLANNGTGYTTENGAPATRVAQGYGWAAQAQPSTTGHLASAAANSRVGEYWVGRARVQGPWGADVSVRLFDGSRFTSPEKVVRMTGAPVDVVLSSDRPCTDTTVRVVVGAADTGNPLGTGVVTLTNVTLERVAGPNYACGPFFDGDSGVDYLWKQGTLPGSTESFYYADRASREGLLRQTISENVALGVVPAYPEFALLPWAYTPPFLIDGGWPDTLLFEPADMGAPATTVFTPTVDGGVPIS